MIGQTDRLAPADKSIYALRDVTATVESIPLIVRRILSKKLAEGIDALVLDVKVGRGAFMKTEKDARALAEALVRVGTAAGKRVVALLTDMTRRSASPWATRSRRARRSTSCTGGAPRIWSSARSRSGARCCGSAASLGATRRRASGCAARSRAGARPRWPSG